MSNQELVLRGEITQISRASTGYGENERTVGVQVTVKATLSDSLGEFAKDISFVIPATDGFHPYVGDKVSISVIHLPVPELVDVEPQKFGDEVALADDDPEEDESVEGNPFAEEIKQGG